MKRKCERKVVIDALTVCCRVESRYHYDRISELDFGACYDIGEFRLYRVEGRYYNNVYNIVFYNGKHNAEFGQLKFNLNRGTIESNTHENGNPKVWISLNNAVLYEDGQHNLDFISTKLGLDVHNITTIDLALDTPFNVAKKLKQLIRNKSVTTILNGKKIVNRDDDRPEITYVNSGSLDKDKYMTVNVKQRNAMKDKTKGVTIICYDKKAEIRNSSDKKYILEYYANPKALYRTEVHLNNAEFKDYIEGHNVSFNYYMMDEVVLENVFFHHLNSVIRFQHGKENIKWEHLLGRVVA